jgi:hypothetical protein
MSMKKPRSQRGLLFYFSRDATSRSTAFALRAPLRRCLRGALFWRSALLIASQSGRYLMRSPFERPLLRRATARLMHVEQ